MKLPIQQTRSLLVLLAFIILHPTWSQSLLPPVQSWNGKSESLIANPSNPWITPSELSDFRTTPSYDATIAWFKKLSNSSPLISMVSIGISPEGRELFLIIGSTEKVTTPEALRKSNKPILLVQAGIHSGEIDGKDAGMMLFRDIAFGNKKELISQVNFLFIPILNVDGHERTSPYNRVNQRGPENMGWRTNAQNLNLNRDYAKLDTKELQAVINVINDYDPLLYMDVHVTDGADYQYDITFGGVENQGYSPGISNWLATTFKQTSDSDLRAQGHIPGQLLFAFNDRDFTQGNVLIMGGPRFSDSYGNLRHLATVLIENHSLKPYKQRVLGTYVLMESTLKTLAKDGKTLQALTIEDKNLREDKLPLAWKVPQMKSAVSFENQSDLQSITNGQAPDSLELLGIASMLVKSPVTNTEYVEWLGTPVTQKIANYKGTDGISWVTRPKGYWIPASCTEVIQRLKIHGIKMEVLSEPRVVKVEMYRIINAKFENEGHIVAPFEGRVQVFGETVSELRDQLFPKGSVYITTDQPLGDLAILLLEPKCADSFLSWGFFHAIFQRTEYIEAYVIEPLAQKMLNESPDLKAEFESKKASDPAFAANQYKMLNWFYSKTNYYDDRYLLYPVGREL